ncbi:MAG TPA: hypothetical protein VJU78_19610 [Chitinophagaceae bacterium]|nr:hypothetical protein [Chitinophagaceae bacterium]
MSFQYPYKKRITLLVLATVTVIISLASPPPISDSTPISTQQQAIAFLDSVQKLDSSKHWPNVDPELFLQNLRTFAISPLRFYEGKGTNFCAYSALTYIPLNYDPLGFSRFMVTLYQKGRARMGKVFFRPSAAIKKEAGLLKYKGALDISPAGQIWFLSLADHFKGYLNFFNRGFDKGDENTLWASTNFAKFNRMLRKLFNLKVHARGADLIRPWIKNTYNYLSRLSKSGPVFVYLNNRLLYKKKHVVTTRFGIPTHFVLLLDIYKTEGNKINIIYWDYGKKTLQQVRSRMLRKIIFGITDFSFKKK